MTPTLIFATEAEAAPLRAMRSDLDIRICGVGAVETAASLVEIIAKHRPEAMVLCGIAGAYDTTLAVGDVVAVECEQTATLPAAYRAEYRATLPLPLKGVVSNTVMSVGAAPCGAQVENMEGAAFFALAARYGIPAAELRAISNYTFDKREDWNIPLALECLTKTIVEIF